MAEQKKHNKDLLEAIGQKYGVSAEEVRRDIEFAIAAASNGSNPEKKRNFRERFGEGTPTLEEAVYVLVKAVKEIMFK